MGSDADDLLSEPPISLEDELGNTDASEYEGSDDELAGGRQPLRRQRVKTVLKEVAIPSSSMTVSDLRRRHRPMSISSSSAGSILSASRDRSTEYDTPATSAVVTPAESLGRGLSLKPLGNRVRTTLPNNNTLTTTDGKRKREHADVLVEADALLARALQEEEYAEKQPKRGRPRKAPRTLVVDSDEDSILSDPPQEDSDEVTLPTPKRTKKSNRPSLPTRAARESARKSITAEMSREVVDTDDSNDISFNYTDMDFDSLEETDEDEVDEDVVCPLSTSTGTTLATAAVATHQASVARRVRRSRHPQRVNNWRQRMQQGMDSRVNSVLTAW